MADQDKVTAVTTMLGVGVNERDQEELVQFGESLAVCENARIDKGGSIVKRKGFTYYVPTASDPATTWQGASRVFAHKNTFCTVNGWDTSAIFTDGAEHGVGVYTCGSNIQTATRLGEASPCYVSRSTVAAMSHSSLLIGTRFADSAVTGAYTCIIHISDSETGGDVDASGTLLNTSTGKRFLHATVIETETGQAIISQRTIGRLADTFSGTTMLYPKVVGVGGRFHIVFQPNGTITSLSLATIDVQTIANIQAAIVVSFGVNLLGSVANTHNFDMCPLSDGTGFILAYQYGATSLGLQRHNLDGTAATTAVATLPTVTNAVFSLSTASGTLWIAHTGAVGHQVYAQSRNEVTLAAAIAPDQVILGSSSTNVSSIVAVAYSSAECFVMASQLDYPTLWGIAENNGGTAQAKAGVAGYAHWVHAASKPFTYKGRTFCLFFPRRYVNDASLKSRPENISRNLWLCDVTPSVTRNNDGSALKPVANIAPRQSMFYVTDFRSEPGRGILADFPVPFVNVNQVATGKFSFASCFIENIVSTSAQLVTVDFTSADRWATAETSDGVVLSGGVPTLVAPASTSEFGFFETGQIRKITVVADGAGIITNARYIVVYQWTDSSGNVHRSAPSDPVSASSLASSRFEVAIPTIFVTHKVDKFFNLSFGTPNDSITAVVYRTENNGVTYYRAGSILMQGSFSGEVTFVDRIPDSTLITRELLYRQPGEIGAILPHVCPPAFQTVTSHNDRMFGVAEDGTTVWFSSKKVPGEGQWFSDIFQFQIESGGKITALASQDGRLYVFKRNEIWAVEGDGPAENGDGEFTPYRLPSDVGCISQRSIAVTPSSLMFQSVRGIETLSRGQQGRWIGESVQSTLDAYPTVTSAVTDAKDGVVLFTCTNGGTGVTLVYDYLLGKWTVDRVASSSNGIADNPAVHACIDGSGRYVRSCGPFLETQSTGNLDGTTWVTLRIVTPWVKSAGLFGEQDAVSGMLMLRDIDGADVTMYAAYNYSGEWTSSRTWQAEELFELTERKADEVELVLGNERRGRSVRFKVEDAYPANGLTFTTPPSAGNRFIAIACMVQGRVARYPYSSEVR